MALGRHQLFRQRVRHKSPRAHTAFKIPFGQKLRVCVKDREAGYLDFGCKLTARRYLLPRTKVARKDRRAVCGVDLLVQGSSPVAIDGDDGQDPGGRVAHCRSIVVPAQNQAQLDMESDHLISKTGRAILGRSFSAAGLSHFMRRGESMPLHVRGIPVPIANESTGNSGLRQSAYLSSACRIFLVTFPQEVGESNDGAGELPRAVDWKPTHFCNTHATVSSGRL